MNRVRIYFLLMMGLFSTLTAVASTLNAATENSNRNINLSQLNDLESQITKQKNSYLTLIRIQGQLDKMNKNATTCVADANEQIQKIDKILGYLSTGLNSTINQHNAFLVQEKAMNKQKLAECSFVSYRSEEIISLIKSKILTLELPISWTKSSSVWELIHNTPFITPVFSASALYQATGLVTFSKTQYIEITLFVVFDLLMACLVFFFIARQKTFISETMKGLTILKHALSMTIILFGALLSLYFIFHAIAPTPGIVLLNAVFLCYLLGIAVLKYLFLWLKESYTLTLLISTVLFRRTVVLCTVILLGSAAFILMRGMHVSEQNIALLKVLTTTAIMLSFFWLSWVLFSFNRIKNKYSFAVQRTMKLILAGLYILVTALFLAGYHSQALMIIPKLVITACMMILAFKLIRTVIRLQHAFDTNESPLAKKIHDKLGFKDNEISPELVVIRSLVFFVISMLTIMAFLQIWGTPDIYLDRIHSFMFQGITVFDITIIPVRIGRAFAMFFIIMLVGRFLSTYVMKSDAFNKEKHVQLTISTLVRYASFIIATVLALYVAGISFAGVAIAIGALMVGVGFGLQQIVSNFVAGLILLTNNVVRPGDFVLVDGTEGTVMKIRLLATEVRTTGSVVLVPNSSLIVKSVTNYTYEGQVYYATLQILIEQMSDLKLAEKIILDVAAKNPRVINDEQNQPCTGIKLFDARATMGVYLSMYFPIATASEQYGISTELIRAILDEFEAQSVNNVQIIRSYAVLPNTDPSK